MLDRTDNPEEHPETAEEFDKALHDKFEPMHESAERDSSGELTVASELERASRVMESKDYRFEGGIGEGVATRVATERLDLTPDPRFDQAYHGMDGMFRDGDGKLVVMEAKLATGGINALSEGQMQPEWVERKAQLMQMEGSKQHTPGNSEIGAEIDEVGVDNVRRVLVVTDPRSLEVTAYEGQPDRSWQELGRWSAFEFEQPNLETDRGRR